MNRFGLVPPMSNKRSRSGLALIIFGILVLQACTFGDLLRQSEIRYPVHSTMESGRPDPPETLALSIAGGAVYEEEANQFHLRSYGERSGPDTTHIYRYYPDYFVSIRMQYAYSDNMSPSIEIFATASPLQALPGDTLFQRLSREERTLIGVEFGMATYEEFTSNLSAGLRLGFRFFQDTYITARDREFFPGTTTTKKKRMLLRIPAEFVLNYQAKSMELIGGIGLTSLVNSTDTFNPNWVNYKLGLRANTSPNWRVTLWGFSNGNQRLLYDRETETADKPEQFSPYLALQIEHYFHLDE